MKNGMRRTAVSILKRGGVGVLPTDTIYGIVGSAFSKKAVARIYRLRKRNPKKPMIVLIGDMRRATFQKFGIRLSPITYHLLATLWPGKISVLLPVAGKKFSYLHRGTEQIAFRLPKPPPWLRAFLKNTGPLVAPSANIEGKPPARTAREARAYFGDRVDFYLDGGARASQPSTLVRFDGGKVVVVRKGAAKVGVMVQ